jgi:hypothetical protein
MIQRQHSTPNPGQGTAFFPAGIKPGALFHIIPTEGGKEERERSGSGSGESTFLMDPASGLIQIISGGTSSKAPHQQQRSGGKEVEIFKTERKSEAGDFGGGSSMDEPMSGGESASGSRDYSLSIDEDPPGTSDQPPVQRSGHCPALRPGPALGCNFCWNSVDKCGRILRRKTKYHCPECHINLCIVPCFQEYHERADKKKVKGKLLLPKPSSM